MKRSWKRIFNWETWPFYMIYAPLGIVWVYYAVKARAFWFFSNVNPTLEFSGFEGETKKEMYQQLPCHLYPKSLYIEAGTDYKAVQEAITGKDFKYPYIVKPEIGMQGILFRKIVQEREHFHYHHNVPVDYIIQDYVDLPLEFSVFHIRYPNKTKGKVTGFILKEYMYVKGNGVSTLAQLIEQHPKAGSRQLEMSKKHAEHLEEIIPKNEIYYLSIAGNHNRGARFINLYKQIDQQLTDVFDTISNQAGEFYFGRYDLKCTSIQDLKEGKNISILEYNGAGAEPNHIYDCGMSYFGALKEVSRHWNDLFEIGKINKKRGVPYWSFMKGYLHLRNSGKFFKQLRKYDYQ